MLQVVLERMGKAERSHDPELEARIERLEAVRSQYLDMMKTAEALLRVCPDPGRRCVVLCAPS
jgi:hypothetical protein